MYVLQVHDCVLLFDTALLKTTNVSRYYFIFMFDGGNNDLITQDKKSP